MCTRKREKELANKRREEGLGNTAVNVHDEGFLAPRCLPALQPWFDASVTLHFAPLMHVLAGLHLFMQQRQTCARQEWPDSHRFLDGFRPARALAARPRSVSSASERVGRRSPVAVR